MDTVARHDCGNESNAEEDLVANCASVCRPEWVRLGLPWKRLPFHTGVNEGAGHMDGRARRERRSGVEAKREET